MKIDKRLILAAIGSLAFGITVNASPKAIFVNCSQSSDAGKKIFSNSAKSLEQFYKNGNRHASIGINISDDDAGTNLICRYAVSREVVKTEPFEDSLKIYAKQPKGTKLRIYYLRKTKADRNLKVGGWYATFDSLIRKYKLDPKLITVFPGAEFKLAQHFHQALPDYKVGINWCHFLHSEERDKLAEEIVKSGIISEISLDWSNLFDAALEPSTIEIFQKGGIFVNVGNINLHDDNEIESALKIWPDQITVHKGVTPAEFIKGPIGKKFAKQYKLKPIK